MARKGALTCLIVLMTFALAGKLIFRMFGITLPAFEIAGGVILLLIGIDMIEARRSPGSRAMKRRSFEGRDGYPTSRNLKTKNISRRGPRNCRSLHFATLRSG